MKSAPSNPWLLMIQQIPHKPDYLRVKIRRRLQQIGAVAARNAVYVLPASEGSLEDFQWIAQEIRAVGGEASICEASFIEGITDEDIRALFEAGRNTDYRAIEEAAIQLGRLHPGRKALDADARLQVGKEIIRLRRQLEEAARIDFFGAQGRAKANAAIAVLEVKLAGAVPPHSSKSANRPADLRGKVWVTRTHIHVDRIASAWLIRRFIDPKARFKFIEEKSFVPAPGEIRFDMFEGEFTHEKEWCSFETIVHRCGIKDEAVYTLAEIIHDIDLKDGKFGREETAGVAAMIAGICRSCPKDEDRLDRGLVLMDDLHASFGGGHPEQRIKRKPKK